MGGKSDRGGRGGRGGGGGGCAGLVSPFLNLSEHLLERENEENKHLPIGLPDSVPGSRSNALVMRGYESMSNPTPPSGSASTLEPWSLAKTKLKLMMKLV